MTWSRSSPRRLCCRDDPALLSASESAGLDAKLPCRDGAALLPCRSMLCLQMYPGVTTLQALRCGQVEVTAFKTAVQGPAHAMCLKATTMGKS